MEVVNPFILKNKERMIVFLDQISNVSDPSPIPGVCILEPPQSAQLQPDIGKFCLFTLLYDKGGLKLLFIYQVVNLQLYITFV